MYVCDKKPYLGCRVYGPYTRRDGRKHVILVNTPKGISGKKITVSYPKFLMEITLERKLDPVLETIDHQDNNFYNNDLSNFKILSLSEHAKQDALHIVPDRMSCIFCGKEVPLKKLKGRHKNMSSKNKKRKLASGPFCSKQCIGKYGAAIQNGRITKLEIKKVRVQYKKLKNIN